MVFDFDTLYNETQGDAFASGKKKFYDNKVRSITTGTQDGKFDIYATVAGDRDYSCKITFDEQGGLYDYSCDCGKFNLESGPCKHIVAAALSFEEKNPDVRFGGRQKRKSDAGAMTLIAEYNMKNRRRFITGDSVKTELIPYLELDGGVSLRFTVGNKKQYNLKDISDFVSCVAAGGYRRYGVDLELYHIPENFTDGSNKLIEFLVKCYREKAEISGAFLKYKDELRLLSSDIDEFFALYEGALVHLGKSDLIQIAPFDAPLPVKLVIEREEEGFSVSLSDSDYRFIDGKDWKYVLIGSRIYRISDDFDSAVRSFFDTGYPNDGTSIFHFLWTTRYSWIYHP